MRYVRKPKAISPFISLIENAGRMAVASDSNASPIQTEKAIRNGGRGDVVRRHMTARTSKDAAKAMLRNAVVWASGSTKRYVAGARTRYSLLSGFILVPTTDTTH